MELLHSAGGSSGGSAAAVAAGLCDVGIGSDTGGSIRLPAAYCGVIGLKPSYGLISRYGMVQYSNSLDTVGILSRSVADISKTFACLQGYDKRDPTAISERNRLKSEELNRTWRKTLGKDCDDLSNLRVGVPIEYFSSELSEEVLDAFRTAVDFLKQRGARLFSVSLPSTLSCLGAYYVIASAEASSNLARYSGLHFGHRSIIDRPSHDGPRHLPRHLYTSTRSETLGSEVKARLLLGTYALSASGMKNYFIQSQKIRLQVRREFNQCFRLPHALSTDDMSLSQNGIDVLLTPPTLNTAPPLDQLLNNWSQDQLLVPASLAGLPSIVIPIISQARHPGSWPTGVQLIGQWGTEPILFLVGSILEQMNNIAQDTKLG